MYNFTCAFLNTIKISNLELFKKREEIVKSPPPPNLFFLLFFFFSSSLFTLKLQLCILGIHLQIYFSRSSTIHFSTAWIQTHERTKAPPTKKNITEVWEFQSKPWRWILTFYLWTVHVVCCHPRLHRTLCQLHQCLAPQDGTHRLNLCRYDHDYSHFIQCSAAMCKSC